MTTIQEPRPASKAFIWRGVELHTAGEVTDAAVQAARDGLAAIFLAEYVHTSLRDFPDAVRVAVSNLNMMASRLDDGTGHERGPLESLISRAYGKPQDTYEVLGARRGEG